ncbi:MAG TPA: acyl-CoA dehydrogenase family protein, partial [Longimicrobiales bacterium]|nr:acyl-CoA dehydrogenase family protein [Longimicrobiales bacterium]
MPEVMQELQEIRTLAREFAQTELRPHVEHWDHERAIGPDTFAHVAELGFFGMLIPDDHGGMGFDLAAYAAVLEQLAWGEPGVALTVAYTTLAGQLIQQYGTDAQRRRWLEPISRGELLPCLAFAEADAGSDLRALTTRAVRTGDDWVLSGTKAWVTNAPNAQLALVLAETEQGLSLFAVPRESGWQIGQRSHTLGLRVLPITELLLPDVRVSSAETLAVIQPDPSGSLAADLGGLSIAAIAVGLAQAALDHAVAYAAEREQFGRKLREFEGLQFKLADLA